MSSSSSYNRGSCSDAPITSNGVECDHASSVALACEAGRLTCADDALQQIATSLQLSPEVGPICDGEGATAPFSAGAFPVDDEILLDLETRRLEKFNGNMKDASSVIAAFATEGDVITMGHRRLNEAAAVSNHSRNSNALESIPELERVADLISTAEGYTADDLYGRAIGSGPLGTVIPITVDTCSAQGGDDADEDGRVKKRAWEIIRPSSSIMEEEEPSLTGETVMTAAAAVAAVAAALQTVAPDTIETRPPTVRGGWQPASPPPLSPAAIHGNNTSTREGVPSCEEDKVTRANGLSLTRLNARGDKASTGRLLVSPAGVNHDTLRLIANGSCAGDGWGKSDGHDIGISSSDTEDNTLSTSSSPSGICENYISVGGDFSVALSLEQCPPPDLTHERSASDLNVVSILLSEEARLPPFTSEACLADSPEQLSPCLISEQSIPGQPFQESLLPVRSLEHATPTPPSQQISVSSFSPQRATAGCKRRRMVCAESGCELYPTYGNPGDERSSYCAGHGKRKGLQNIVAVRCRHRFPMGGGPCPLWPAFGRKEDKTPTFCAHHALPGMENINNPRCRETGCNTWPSFGVLGTKSPVYCAAHKVDGMVDVVKPRCRGDDNGCPRRPTFGRPADKVPTFCKAHKPPGMVDVANPRCTHPDCQRRPSFGVTRGRRALRCATHKLKGMVDVRKPRCQEPSCERIAYFNVKEVKGATRCSRHQEEGMVRK